MQRACGGAEGQLCAQDRNGTAVLGMQGPFPCSFLAAHLASRLSGCSEAGVWELAICFVVSLSQGHAQRKKLTILAHRRRSSHTLVINTFFSLLREQCPPVLLPIEQALTQAGSCGTHVPVVTGATPCRMQGTAVPGLCEVSRGCGVLLAQCGLSIGGGCCTACRRAADCTGLHRKWAREDSKHRAGSASGLVRLCCCASHRHPTQRPTQYPTLCHPHATMSDMISHDLTHHSTLSACLSSSQLICLL